MKTTLSLLSFILLSTSVLLAEPPSTTEHGSYSLDLPGVSVATSGSVHLSQDSLVYAPEASKVLMEMKRIAKAVKQIKRLLPEDSSIYQDSIEFLVKVRTNIEAVEGVTKEAIGIGKESGVPYFDTALTEQQAHDEVAGIVCKSDLLCQHIKNTPQAEEILSPEIFEFLKTLAATTDQMTLQLTIDVDTLKKEHPRVHQGYHAAYFNKACVEAALDNILKPLEVSESNL